MEQPSLGSSEKHGADIRGARGGRSHPAGTAPGIHSPLSSVPDPSPSRASPDPPLGHAGVSDKMGRDCKVPRPHRQHPGRRADVTLPSTTGGVLLVGGASGVEVGGKRTLKSQNWDAGCGSSSSSVSSANPAPVLPMASLAGLPSGGRRQANSLLYFYAGPGRGAGAAGEGRAARGWP